MFDDIASLVRRDVDPQILSDICKGLQDENPYCIELRFLGAEARELSEGIVVVPRMTNQPTHFDVCSIMNNGQTGEMKLQVEMHSHSVSNVSLDSEKVEGLCVPLLFCHGEPGYTNQRKSCLSLDEYAMARLLRPEKSVSGYVTAHAGYVPLQYMDGRTGEPFAPTEAQSEVDFNLAYTESKSFHVACDGGPILAYGFLLSSP